MVEGKFSMVCLLCNGRIEVFIFEKNVVQPKLSGSVASSHYTHLISAGGGHEVGISWQMDYPHFAKKVSKVRTRKELSMLQDKGRRDGGLFQGVYSLSGSTDETVEELFSV